LNRLNFAPIWRQYISYLKMSLSFSIVFQSLCFPIISVDDVSLPSTSFCFDHNVNVLLFFSLFAFICYFFIRRRRCRCCCCGLSTCENSLSFSQDYLPLGFVICNSSSISSKLNLSFWSLVMISSSHLFDIFYRSTTFFKSKNKMH
jgi:hypothetical protein